MGSTVLIHGHSASSSNCAALLSLTIAQPSLDISPRVQWVLCCSASSSSFGIRLKHNEKFVPGQYSLLPSSVLSNVLTVPRRFPVGSELGCQVTFSPPTSNIVAYKLSSTK